jgi:hypothetical protein
MGALSVLIASLLFNGEPAIATFSGGVIAAVWTLSVVVQRRVLSSSA